MVHVPVYEPLDLNPMLEGGTFVEYAGSMTSPPCTENSVWMVRREPITISDNQALYLYQGLFETSAGYGNYRGVMPMNGREAKVRKAVRDMPVPKAPKLEFPLSNRPTKRENLAQQWANEAFNQAQTAMAFAKDLDRRWHRSRDLDGLTMTMPPTTVLTTTVNPQMLVYEAETMAKVISSATKDAVSAAIRQVSYQAQQTAVAAAQRAVAETLKAAPAPAPKTAEERLADINAARMR